MAARKLLFYIHSMSGGGAERVFALLASGFVQRGDDVILAVDFESSDNAGHVDAAVRRVTLGGNHFAAVWRLSRLIARERPDISMSALSASNHKHLLAAMLTGRLSRAIQTYHGYAHSEPQPLSRLAYVLTFMSSRLFARTVAVSDGLLASIRRHWQASAERSLRIYNPVAIDTGEEHGHGPPLAERAPIVLSAGRFVAYKNFPALVRAFAQVEPAEARLVILGEGPDKPAIEAEIVRLGLQMRVSLPGYIAAPAPTFRQARCFALASDSESFGMVVVEALAHGLPVVATNSDGPREILAAADLGTLVAQEDPGVLARAITHYLAEPGDAAPRMARAREFSTEQAVAAYSSLFDAISSRAAAA